VLHDAHNSGWNPRESSLDPTNVESLTLLWQAQDQDDLATSPIVSGGLVYAMVGEDSTLSAFAVGCGVGGETCAPVWTADLHGGFSIRRGVIYAIDDYHLVAVDAASCATGTCRRVWTSSTSSSFSYPMVSRGYVYVNECSTCEVTRPRIPTDTLQVFDADACGAPTCDPGWRGHVSGNTTPSVGGGFVMVGKLYHDLWAFPSRGCGQPTCTAVWKGTTPSTTSTPAVSRGVAYTATIGTGPGQLSAFEVSGCGAEVCPPLWTVDLDGNTGLLSSPAAGDGKVFVVTLKSFRQSYRLYAFDANGCAQPPCQPLWQARLQNYATGPTVANGVVYLMDYDGRLLAFDAAGCGAPRCDPLVSIETGAKNPIEPPVISRGVVYTSSGSFVEPNFIRAYGLPADRGPMTRYR